MRSLSAVSPICDTLLLLSNLSSETLPPARSNCDIGRTQEAEEKQGLKISFFATLVPLSDAANDLYAVYSSVSALYDSQSGN